jgi:crotonobetainyl-CoA:carnitine CoA-transferase CaiB-like acyl-CoA transferase
VYYINLSFSRSLLDSISLELALFIPHRSIMVTVTENETTYSVPSEARKIYQGGILKNPLIAKDLPREIHEFSNSVHFEGSDLPSIPINWRFAESAASLKALEASLIAALLERKYNRKVASVTINTDHAQLFFASCLLWTIHPEANESSQISAYNSEGVYKYIKNYDFHKMNSSLHRINSTNIYKTKDGRFFHLHGSMNPDPTLDSIGLPHDAQTTTWEEACKAFSEKLSQIESSEIQRVASDVYRQAGVVCESLDSFRSCEHGKANAHVGLFEIHLVSNPLQPATWWTATAQTSALRPLAGLKVVDLTRVIAAPALTRGLAELGASVMRVTSPNICDYSSLHIDLNWGKWNCSIDLKTEEGKKQLKTLILDADVVVQGYRPGVLDKYGFGQDGVIDICKDRERGIISVRENCYGWNGPWSYLSGWQQISDACVGISWAFGKAMGLQNGEPVTPVFPNSDYMTGVAGVSGVLCALMKRAEQGGSYKLDVALNYYNQWLANSVGEYPDTVWQDVWEKNGRQVFR